MENQRKAERIVNTLTGSWEKRNLPKMAKALPQWVSPDHLTILGIIAGFIIAIGYILTWYSNWWLLLSNFGLLIHWYADSLDGTLARVRHTERENYGYFVDHICDAWTIVIICVAFGLSPLIHIEVGLFLTIGYLLLNIYAHVGAYSEKIFRISFVRLGPTEIRIAVCIVNFILIFWNPVVVQYHQTYLTVFDLCGIIVAIIFVMTFIIASIKDAVKLDRMDRGEEKV